MENKVNCCLTVVFLQLCVQVEYYTLNKRRILSHFQRRKQYATRRKLVVYLEVIPTCYFAIRLRYEQPIMRIEDRLFDRGWVRSAMATRKCGNFYFRKYFMAVRKFTNIFVLLLILMVGSRDTLFLVCLT